MKKVLLTIIFLSASYAIYAQNVTAELKAYLRQNGWNVATEQYAYLSEGESASYSKIFYAGTEYTIIAYSEESGVMDIDVFLYDEDGSLLEEDSDNADVATVGYAPYVSREMSVVFMNYDSVNSIKEYNCKLMIAYK